MQKGKAGMADQKVKVRSSKNKAAKAKIITLPLTKADVLKLSVGDMVLINGRIITGRDKAHRFLFNEKSPKAEIPFDLEGSIIYHCGPIIKNIPGGYEVVASGPTTSMRVEMYEAGIISEYGLAGVMGKGGMGVQTMSALKKYGCVYLNTIGGAAVYLAERVRRVVDVWKLEEFGMTEAMWVLEVENFPAIVTMDAHGESLHKDIEAKSDKEFRKLIGVK